MVVYMAYSIALYIFRHMSKGISMYTGFQAAKTGAETAHPACLSCRLASQPPPVGDRIDGWPKREPQNHHQKLHFLKAH